MKIIIAIFLLILIFKIFEIIENIQKKKLIEKKENFKKEIYNFSLKFLQPLIKDDEKYLIFQPLNVDTVKIYEKLLQENFNSDFINDDVDALNIQNEEIHIKNTVGSTIQEKQIALEKLNKLNQKKQIYLKTWNFKDSYDYLNDLYFNCLFEKFINEFANDNENCVDDWSVIRECYIKTFTNNMKYVPFIQEYLIKKQIDVPFDIKDISKIENNIKTTIEQIAFKKTVNDYKNVMNQNKKFINNEVTIEEIDTMSGQEFEEFLQNLFEKLNYEVKMTKTTGDQGADLIIEKFGIKTVVQAKCYKNVVSNKAIQEAVASIKFYGAKNAMVVTNNYFTKSAIALALSNNVELWDRNTLSHHLKSIYWNKKTNK